jgi:hypothetical protein
MVRDTHIEEWGVGCLDDWERWYGSYAEPFVRDRINRIRDLISDERTPDDRVMDLYLDGVEYLHLLFIRSMENQGYKIISERLDLNIEGDVLGYSTIEYEN